MNRRPVEVEVGGRLSRRHALRQHRQFGLWIAWCRSVIAVLRLRRRLRQRQVRLVMVGVGLMLLLLGLCSVQRSVWRLGCGWDEW